MLRTYEGTLRGNRIDWSGDAPTPKRALRVHVTVLDEDAGESQGRHMAAALERLAESGAFSGIDDPSEWQREVRAARPLPGRKVE